MARPKAPTAKVVSKKEVWRVVEPHIQAFGTLTTYEDATEKFTPEGHHYKVRLTPKGQKPIIRRTYSLSNARRILNAKQIDVDRGVENINEDRITFTQLVAEFSKTLTPPVYEADPHNRKRKLEKLSGLAGWQDGLRAMKMFDEVWGNRTIRSIKPDEIKAWKATRHTTKRGKREDIERTASGVNGELRFLSKAFNLAIEKGWLDRNPVRGIIKAKYETKRETALTDEEESKLLDAALELDYTYLRMLLIFLFDTGMRLGEANGLTRGDIKLNQGIYGHIYLPAKITKGKERRNLPVLTPRLRQVIEQRFAMIPDDPKALLFGKETSIRFAWDAVRAKAHLHRHGEPLDVELRDTRHTWISFAVKRGIPLPQAMLYSGHKVVDTFLRYLQPDQEAHDQNVERYTAHLPINQIQEPLQSAQVN